MARQFSSQANYLAFYSRVEAQFSISDLTKEALTEWLRNSELADLFSLTREVSLQIEKAETIEQLKELRIEANNLIIHKDKILIQIDTKMEEVLVVEKEIQVAESFARVEIFAKEKGIELSDKIVGREELWGTRRVLVIRDAKGHFKSWRKI